MGKKTLRFELKKLNPHMITTMTGNYDDCGHESWQHSKAGGIIVTIELRVTNNNIQSEFINIIKLKFSTIFFIIISKFNCK